MIYAGIDPGLTGGLALLDADGAVLEAWPMPVLLAPRGRREYHVAEIRDTLERWRQGQVFVTVEQLHAMPARLGGSLANYNRGLSNGFAWMLQSLRIPFSLVNPATWQRRMLEGTAGSDTKQRAVIACGRRFPAQDLRATARSKKPHDGIADALLIADYGRCAHPTKPIPKKLLDTSTDRVGDSVPEPFTSDTSGTARS